MNGICGWCGQETTREGVTEFYELLHHHRSEGNELLDIGGGRKMRLPDFDLMSEDTKVFCSPKCLAEYVAARIAPDAAE